ncbi:hypothetical protein J6590_084929 [Homalodisca vitripennis]|nr:hypothetical protein J6590_084929 [Homalodisca vitripennis]
MINISQESEVDMDNQNGILGFSKFRKVRQLPSRVHNFKLQRECARDVQERHITNRKCRDIVVEGSDDPPRLDWSGWYRASIPFFQTGMTLDRMWPLPEYHVNP